MTDVREEQEWKALKAGGFMDRLGPLLTARDKEAGYVYALETDEGHANVIGLIHGGVITALLDQVIAMVAWTEAGRAPTVTVQMDTRFVGAAKPGARLEARAKLNHRAGSMLFLEAELRDGTRLVALASAVMKIARKAA